MDIGGWSELSHWQHYWQPQACPPDNPLDNPHLNPTNIASLPNPDIVSEIFIPNIYVQRHVLADRPQSQPADNRCDFQTRPNPIHCSRALKSIF